MTDMTRTGSPINRDGDLVMPEFSLDIAMRVNPSLRPPENFRFGAMLASTALPMMPHALPPPAMGFAEQVRENIQAGVQGREPRRSHWA